MTHPEPLQPTHVDVLIDAPTPLRADTPRVGAPYGATRPSAYRPRRSRWPGLLAAGIVGSLIAGVVYVSVVDRPPEARPAPAVATNGSTSVPSAASVVGPDAVVANGAPPAVERTTATSAAGVDATITAQVRAALTADPALGAEPIDVSTHAGVVTLSGAAPDPAARERAAVIAAAPVGVLRVDNQLVVSPPSGG
jgi:hypothetical protein